MKNILKNGGIAMTLMIMTIQSNPSGRNGLSGSWSKYPGARWDIYSDSTYAFSIGFGIHMIGQYDAIGNQLQLSEQSGSLLALLCGSRSGKVPIQGEYYFQVEGSKMRITQYNEDCTERKGEIPGTYYRL